MRLALLFWFYKELPLCLERLAQLRTTNPGVPIYGLYGGSSEHVAELDALAALCDDLYIYPAAVDPNWKWLNGDQLLSAWHRDRGVALDWDTVVVVQWDLLMLAPASTLFAPLRPDEAVFSGFRPLEEVRPWWGWAGARDPSKAEQLAAFKRRLAERWSYAGPLWCCLFIVVALPRTYLARYAAEAPAEGFLEYKMPSLARVWNVPVRTDLGFHPWWAADPATREALASARVLNAVGDLVTPETVRAELARPDGARVFHPFVESWPA